MKRQKRHRFAEQLFKKICLTAAIAPLVVLLLLLGNMLFSGLERLDISFLTSLPSRKAELAGIWPALVGSFYLMGLTALFALPLGVGAATYLEEFGRSHKIAGIIEVNIANLAGVPSVIYGLLGLEIFVRVVGFGHTLIAGALTLALLILPIVITSVREALRTVPSHLQEAALALGATKMQTIWKIVWPMSLPGILTGAILSLSRAIGETAPLVVVGAATYMAFVPEGIFSDFTALPIQIFNWVSRPQKEFLVDAAAGIIVLLAMLLLMNSFAIILRNRLQARQGG